MDSPEGMDHEEDKCLLLKKTIYGLVQSARVYYETYSKEIKSFGFKKSPADPCLFYGNDEDGICIILCYVDDNLAVGHQKSIDKLLKQLDNNFLSSMKEDVLTDYLSCEIRLNEEKDTAWMGQP